MRASEVMIADPVVFQLITPIFAKIALNIDPPVTYSTPTAAQIASIST